jgi:hypothetical protein
MVALGNNAHIFARPHRRESLRRLFGELIGCPVATIDHPAMAEPMLVVRFPGGGSLSVEFVAHAPDSDEPRFGAWLELRSESPADLVHQLLEAGIPEVEHPGHPHYFMAPGGQVFTVVPLV